MGDKSNIEWTDASWNPITGCSRKSKGCENCYAERMAGTTLVNNADYKGTVKQTTDGPRWTGHINFIEDRLMQPLLWKRPRRIFVNSMSDLFHENVPFEFIDKVFAVMMLAHWHVFQILTKRADIMYDYLCNRVRNDHFNIETEAMNYARYYDDKLVKFPLPNVLIGVSVENQETSNDRIRYLNHAPAAIKFISYEPALDYVNFIGDVLNGGHILGPIMEPRIERIDTEIGFEESLEFISPIDWIIVGGESGVNARPFDINWARHIIAQCRKAGVACFVKQFGSNPVIDGKPLSVNYGKNGNMALWPEDLRVREYPNMEIFNATNEY